MPKKKAVEEGPTVEQLQDALNQARTGLVRIANLKPINFTKAPAHSRGLGFVRAFDEAQTVAEKTIMTMTDKLMANV